MNKRQQKKKLAKTKQLRKENKRLATKWCEVQIKRIALIAEKENLQEKYELALESNKNLRLELENYRRIQQLSYFTKEVAIPKMSLMFKGDVKLEARKALVDTIAQNEEIFELKETDTLLIYKLTCIKKLDEIN